MDFRSGSRTETPRVPPFTVACHTCRGRFGFAYSIEQGRPIAYHSQPYCDAFNAIETLMDALRHAELCDLTVKLS